MAEIYLVGYTYRGQPMAYALERAAAYGYSGIELRDFADIDLSTPRGVSSAVGRASAIAHALGMTVGSVFHAPLPVSRETERKAEEQAFSETLCALADHGVPILHTRLSLWRRGSRRETVAADAREEDYAAVQATLARIALLAEARGIRVAIETHMGTSHDTAASQLRIVSAADSPYIVASPDWANMLITHRDEPLDDAIRALAPYTGYMHIKNLKLTPWGYDWNLPVRWGDINYRRVFAILKEVGYTGPLAVEYCGTGDPDVFAADDAHYLRELATQVGL